MCVCPRILRVVKVCVCVCFRRWELSAQLKQWHLKVIEIVKRGQHRKSLDKLFQGFKPAVESCYFNWELAYPLPGITYSSADKKSASFCWARAVQQQRGARAAQGEGEPGAGGPGRPGAAEAAGGPEHKSRGGGPHPPQQEAAVRPKETLASKRKGLPAGGGGVLGRLGGGVALDDGGGGKGMYKGGGGVAGGGSSSSMGGKAKLSQGGKACGGGAMGVGGKHGGGSKQRTSSEDSSLEPDLAELSLDDGSSLALGAEASNTFHFLPPPPEMLPAPSPLLREPRKYAVAKETAAAAFDGRKRVAGHAPPPAEASSAFPKESAAAGTAPPTPAVDKEVDVEEEMEEDCGEDPLVDGQPSASVAAAAANPPQEAEVGGAEAAPGPQAADGPPDPAGEDDYQAYYLSAASEEGLERGVPDSHEEEPDIFAGIKPLEQEGRMEVSGAGLCCVTPGLQARPHRELQP